METTIVYWGIMEKKMEATIILGSSWASIVHFAGAKWFS